jgi:hypothetical protein
MHRVGCGWLYTVPKSAGSALMIYSLLFEALGITPFPALVALLLNVYARAFQFKTAYSVTRA